MYSIPNASVTITSRYPNGNVVTKVSGESVDVSEVFARHMYDVVTAELKNGEDSWLYYKVPLNVNVAKEISKITRNDLLKRQIMKFGGMNE